jgi:hypothetical protein
VTEHEITDIRQGSGELSFEARIGDRVQRVWLRSSTEFVPNPEAALAACVMPAMRLGGRLRMPEAVSPRMLRGQREFQAIQRVWSRDWGFGEPQLQEVEVMAPTHEPPPARRGRVAAFFSGGVDSWSTVLDNPEITDLIFVRGFDLIPGWEQHMHLADEVEARLREAADALGLPLHVIHTNLRELSDPLVRWDIFFGAALDAASLFMAPLLERVLIASDSDYEVQVARGVSRQVDQLWSTEHLQIAEDGGRHSRIERLRRIASHPVVQRSLRVCWENPGGRYNCGTCEKCLMTMTSLEALGIREGMATFPRALDPEAIARVEAGTPNRLSFWEDVLDAVRAAGRVDLEPPVETVVQEGRRSLGLAPHHRRRSQPGPPPLRPEAQRRHEAFAAAESANGDAAAMLSSVLSSRSWRITAPLRALGPRFHQDR